jgi:hypothetical protein
MPGIELTQFLIHFRTTSLETWLLFSHSLFFMLPRKKEMKRKRKESERQKSGNSKSIHIQINCTTPMPLTLHITQRKKYVTH